jgi:hypothetical protein
MVGGSIALAVGKNALWDRTLYDPGNPIAVKLENHKAKFGFIIKL